MAHILVIDDSPGVRQSLAYLLGGAGHTVHTSPSAKDGLWLAAEFRPDLVLLDIQMPGMDGYAACRSIVADERLSETKVILMTPCVDRETATLAVDCGAAGAYDKLRLVENLSAIVASHLAPRAPEKATVVDLPRQAELGIEAGGNPADDPSPGAPCALSA